MSTVSDEQVAKSAAKTPPPDVFETPLFVTPTTKDPIFHSPVIDSETDVGEGSLAHRLFRGHFVDTQVHFNFYLPAPARFRNRFFQLVYPLQTADARDFQLAFSFEQGGYRVQVSGKVGYRHEAAAAKFSREVASKYYGVPPDEIYGYIYGGSGGSIQTVGAMENTMGIWQGGVPYVQGIPFSMPNCFTASALATLVLEPKQDAIRDAVQPGGSGDPYESLSSLEAEILKEYSRFGGPDRCWEWLSYSEQGKTLSVFLNSFRHTDPTYADDFWTKPGYVGTEQSAIGDYIRGLRFNDTVEITNITAHSDGKSVILCVPGLLKISRTCIGADFRLVDAAGNVLIPDRLGGSLDLVKGEYRMEKGSRGVPSDARLHIDNSWFLAGHFYHRHQIPTREGAVAWDQYKNPDGSARYPRRASERGPVLCAYACGGGTHTGRYSGKMIVACNLADKDAFPWYADWYRGQVKRADPDYNSSYRLWYHDNADHIDGPLQPHKEGRLVRYDGLTFRALIELYLWAEQGVEPPESTKYDLRHGQVIVPKAAASRGGIQPVVELRVGGGKRIDVSVGEEVEFQASIEVPPGTGEIVRAEWNFDGGPGNFHSVTIIEPGERLKLVATHRYGSPRTVFACLRVASARDGKICENSALAWNLDRVRVVVL
jgi:hypothetical protein